jgi:hypothetical protein
VKAAILLTLNNLLEKIPTFLKPFLPQLQRTFAKSLADPSSEVLRTRAAKALGTLITLTPRIDPLIAELVTGSKTSDAGVRNAMLKALYEVISKAGSNMSEGSRSSVLGLIDTDTEDNDDNMAITNARLLGALIKNVPSESAGSLIKNRVMTTSFSHSSVLALNSVLLESPQSLTESAFVDDLPALICQGISSKNVSFAVTSSSEKFRSYYFFIKMSRFLTVLSRTSLRTTVSSQQANIFLHQRVRASKSPNRCSKLSLHPFNPENQSTNGDSPS